MPVVEILILLSWPLSGIIGLIWVKRQGGKPLTLPLILLGLSLGWLWFPAMFIAAIVD